MCDCWSVGWLATVVNIAGVPLDVEDADVVRRVCSQAGLRFETAMDGYWLITLPLEQLELLAVNRGAFRWEASDPETGIGYAIEVECP